MGHHFHGLLKTWALSFSRHPPVHPLCSYVPWLEVDLWRIDQTGPETYHPSPSAGSLWAPEQHPGSLTKEARVGSCLVIQWLQIHLAMQGTQVESLVGEPHASEQLSPALWSPTTTTREPSAPQIHVLPRRPNAAKLKMYIKNNKQEHHRPSWNWFMLTLSFPFPSFLFNFWETRWLYLQSWGSGELSLLLNFAMG